MTERLIQEAIDLADRVDLILALDRSAKRVQDAPSILDLWATEDVQRAWDRVREVDHAQ